MSKFSLAQSKRRTRSCCCCVCSQFTCILLSCLFTLFLIVGIVLLVFFLYPRPPVVTVTSIQPNTDAGVQNLVQVTEDNSGFRTFWKINMDVYNPNYVNVKLDAIKASVFSEYYNASQVPLAFGEKNDIKFTKLQTTALEFPMTINYSARNDSSFRFAQYLIQSCTLATQKLKLNYVVNLKFSLLAWTGWTYDYRSDYSFACPLNDTTSTRLISGLIRNTGQLFNN